MPGRHRNSRVSLEQNLDREVYQVVRKIIDEHEQFNDESIALNFAQVYDAIKRSNSSLGRKNKKLLEDSIERVLGVIEGEQQQSDGLEPIEGYDTGLEASTQPQQGPAHPNGLNRSIVGMWSTTSQNPSEVRKLDDTGGDGPRTYSPPSSKRIPKKRRQTESELPSKKRRAATVNLSPPSHVSISDLGGVDNVIQELQDLIVLPMTNPQLYVDNKIQPLRGILLHGPAGCGKTMIANAFAAELGVNFITIYAPEIVSGVSGESEKALREQFDAAKKAAPCLIFIDEIDAITTKRESAQREMDKRMVAQLRICMDNLSLAQTGGKPVIVLAATNRPDSLDVGLRRGGRFDREINMSLPSEPVREQILRALTRDMPLANGIDFALLAKQTPGFVGADLRDLVSTAVDTAMKRYLSLLKSDAINSTMDITSNDLGATKYTLSPTVASLRQLIAHAKSKPSTDSPSDQPQQSQQRTINLTLSDFLLSLPRIQPSSLREGFATCPATTFADIGAHHSTISELHTSMINPILEPQLYARFGITTPTGLLLWGPPGCGKTLLAKAVANASHANFISIRGPELLNKFVGESERAVRQIFDRARSSVPCVVFIDELDALVPRRSDSSAGVGGDSSARVVSTLLTELDGFGPSRDGVYMIAATNRPDIIDPALLRPGRIDKLIFVDLPDKDERVEILRTLILRAKLPPLLDISEQNKGGNGGGATPFSPELDLIARSCDGFSGADLNTLLRRAAYAAIKRATHLAEAGGGTEEEGFRVADFVEARKGVEPSVKERDVLRYRTLRREWEGVGGGEGGRGVEYPRMCESCSNTVSAPQGG